MRLIDADELQFELGKAIPQDASFGRGVTMCKEIIDHAQTIDAVRHGHWIADYGQVGINECSRCGVYECSVCGFEGSYIRRYSYCPSCGTKMDENIDKGDQI